MCRVEERVYVTEEGHRQAFEESFRCDQARPGKLCRNVKRKTVEYLSRPPQVSRDDASSPASYDPPTPTGNGPYMVETRAPAAPGRRLSTRDGARVIKPEIIIEFGARKDKSKKYRPGSTKYKRSSLGTSSINSNDVAVESPGSEASYTVRTGFPEASIQQPEPAGYTTQPAVPRGHRHTSSASSHTTSSQPPSLYAASDPDSPSHRRAPRYPPTIVHNPPPSPTATRGPAPVPSSPYRTTIAEPKKHTENVGADGIFPVDYSSFASSSRPSSSRAAAAAPEIFDRDADRARQRAEKKRQQEEADLEIARKFQQEEDARQAAIELGRAKARAEERAENAYAQLEKRRFEEREELRRQKQQEEKERAAREARKEADRLSAEVQARKDADSKHRKKDRDSRPPTRDHTKRTRRRSMSQHDIIERERLLAAEKARMAVERNAAEIREREEQAALLAEQQARANLIRQQQEQASLLRQPQEQVTLPRQQEDLHYWDPRGGNRLPMTNNTAGMGRRNSVSARRGSISAAPGVPPPPMGGLDRRNSTRRPSISITQPAPPGNLPPINTGLASAQPSSYVRPPSARHSSYDQENPFALPPPRVSNTSQDNPFSTSANWDTRDMREALPRESLTTHARQPSDDRFQHSLRRRGEEVIERAAADGKSRKHDRARQATRNMSKVVGFEDDYENDDSGDEVNRGYETRGKHSKSGGKRRAQ